MKNKSFIIGTIVVIFCCIMAIVDGVLKADYFIKSAIKLVLFLGFPALYALTEKELKITPLFKFNKRSMGLSIGLSISVYLIIVGGYTILKDVFDFSQITKSLTENIGVTRNNFIFVSLYISFINSLLEEFFFRGFAFLTLKQVTSRCFAYFFSASAFAIYHIAMMIGWFSMELLFLVLLGLFAGGMLFNYLNEKTGNIYPSWLVHMFANFAINTIGFILFGII